MELKLALVGFGVVGQGFARLLVDKRDELRQRYGLSVTVVAISDKRLGGVLNRKGVDLEDALSTAEGGQLLDTLAGTTKGLCALETIEHAGADVVVEATWTDLQTGQPAISHVERAFRKGCHVLTTNKGPVALAHKRLSALARACGVTWRYEGTVMSGTPAISLCKEALAGATVRRVRGILNGTTNFMLTLMDRGATFDQALKQAQDLGYAEADPRGDVDGYDAAGKLLILANAVMGGALGLDDVERQGIARVTPGMLERARQDGATYKLVAQVERAASGALSASVRPTVVPRTSFLGAVDGARNALVIDTDALGEVAITGPGAGRTETGFALLSDLLNLAWGLQRRPAQKPTPKRVGKPAVKPARKRAGKRAGKRAVKPAVKPAGKRAGMRPVKRAMRVVPRRAARSRRSKR